MDKFQKIKDSMESFQKQITKEGSDILQESFKEIFDKYPEINSFSWTQYTPYFNDGEECIFHCRGLSEINEIDEWDYYNDEEDLVVKENKKKICEEIGELIESIPDDILKSIYGDHCKVIIKRDEPFEIEEYDHE